MKRNRARAHPLKRILDFLEHPLFLAPIGILAGIVGVVFLAPLLLICGVCVMLALHRSELVADCSVLPSQFSAYVITGVAIVVLLSMVNTAIQTRETEFEGLLTPANEPTPDNICSRGGLLPRQGSMLMIAGGSASFTTFFPQTVFKIGDDPIVTMNKIGDKIAISAKLFSEDGRIIAELHDNRFSINRNNFFRRERPDQHTLVVFDQRDVQVLYVRFINKSTIKFLGVIRHPSKTVLISETEGVLARGLCAGYSVVAFSF
jgi:hypothetical protein